MFKTVIIWSILTIIAIHCEKARATDATTYQVSLIQGNQCPFLFYFNNITKQCKCLSSLFDSYRNNVVKCANGRVLLDDNYCMTYKKDTSTISLSFCPYFELSDHIISEPGYIDLPDNISELNDYMCGPMNRRGIVCSECIDGYGPSVTSPNYRCSDCTNAWYGVPLYLLLELVPVTVFYLIVLIFQLNTTSAPMPSFVFCSNIIRIIVNYFIQHPSQAVEAIFSASYGIWTLDFFRYAIPPFCISPNLEIIHVLYLQSVSTIFPLILIATTWICIKLHSRDYKIVVWLWQLLNRVLIFKHINVKWNSSRTVVDAFATFFLLLFSKVTLILLLPLYPYRIYNLNNVDLSSSVTYTSLTDPRVNFVSKEHLPFAIISIAIFLFTVLPLVVLLALYPIQSFRSLLFKCLPKRSIGPLNILVEKFYSCYRDGLDGGRDMRSLASLYFFLVLFAYTILPINGLGYFLVATLFGGCSLFITSIQPYKKKYMSVIDSLILANMALLSAALDIYTTPFLEIVVEISYLIPALGLLSFVLYKLLKKPLKPVFALIKQKLPQVKSRLLLICCNGHVGDRARDEEQGTTNNDCDDIQLPDRVEHPEHYNNVHGKRLTLRRSKSY